MIRSKLCGLTTREAVDVAVAEGAAFLGFVFYPKSPRNITAEKAVEISNNIPVGIKKVAVLVDPTNEEIAKIIGVFTPDYLQLHGNESLERTEEIKEKFGLPIIKAFKIRDADDLAKANAYQEVVDMFLFDSKAPLSAAEMLPGGNGLIFDWELLAGREFAKPWFLSGGLNSGNIEEAARITGTTMVDVSSGLESAPGVKDVALVKGFLGKCRDLP